MRKNIDEYLYNEAIKYLGRYPATKKKIEDYLEKKIKNKKIYLNAGFRENIEKDILIKNIVLKLDELNIINEDNYLESMFNYYKQSLFSFKKIKNKLIQKGFDRNKIDDYISLQLQENPQLEIDICNRYIQKKKLGDLEVVELKKKLYQQCFSENSIYKIVKE